MVWELHIWGPAFSLPSIDPQCLAAIAYCSQLLPRGQWVLKAGGDPRRSPTLELPALRDGDIWIGGFAAIVDYVEKCSDGRWCLDADLEPREKADCVAFSSFLEARGRSLLDLSLYVSSRNYTAVTSAVYSSIQPFPLTYITPHAIRSAAKSRTAHLGLSSLDIDSDTSHESPEQNVIPPSLRRAPLTLSSLLSQSPEHAAQIRLDALATSFFEPLRALLGEKRFFLSSSPTSLDCLALGYLSLALLPDLPSPWLARCMREKFPRLVTFVEDLQKSCFGGSVHLEDACLFPGMIDGDVERERIRRARGKGLLPWSSSGRAGVFVLSGQLISGIVDSIPLLSWFRPRRVKRRAVETKEVIISTPQRNILATTTTVLLGIGLLLGYSLHGFLELNRGNRDGKGMIWSKWVREGDGRDTLGREGGGGGEAERKGEGGIQVDSTQDLLLALGGRMDLDLGGGGR